MMLVEDGVIQLTDPISKFLPAFKTMQVSVASTGADGKATYTNVPAAKPIIVQGPLRHSAGLAYAEITKNEPVKAAYVEAKFSQPGVHEYDSRGMTRPSKSSASPRRRSFTSRARCGNTAWPSIFSAASSSGIGQTACRLFGGATVSSRSRWRIRAFGFPHQRCRGWRSHCRSTWPRVRK